MAHPDATRAWVADVVRSGLQPRSELRDHVVAAIAADHPELPADATADAWIAAAEAAWREDAATWPAVTDHDRLERAFALLEEKDVVVLQGVADHWVARDELARRVPRPAGIAWFTPTDVWHAIDAGMLEVNLWHGTTANVAPGDALLDDALAAFAAAGLDAHFDEGRIEVAARWQRRPDEPA
ncbi:DUF6891 domain-containing protein [Nocardioides pocheonensis]|jgi:hypothetical protein|uniref:DUF6891 domain-containing protein n=1 Tax=Nocardioides pocheonensis TaxID=661485 RepID=A0A3N0GM18_9ACTN|nr:hypothetical protein [Nocardioides pocheonensis]RNM13266.1 hypothetical protein EFL26_15735 [Nocardioides pocheonensis]